MSAVPHDITLTVAAIEAHDRERARINDSIEVFARDFATDCGEPLGDNWYFDEWELYAGRIHARFSYSDQCGTERETIKFPTLALSDPVERTAAIESRKAEIDIKAQAVRDAETRRLQVESDRLLAKIERRQREAAIVRGEIKA